MMKRLFEVLLILFAAALLWTSAEAQDTPKKKIDVDAIFKKLDTNNDGKLSKDEFLKLAERFKDRDKAREKLTTTFMKIDTTNMGVSLEQFRKYFDNVRR